MPILKSCLFCFSPRTGSMLSAILSMQNRKYFWPWMVNNVIVIIIVLISILFVASLSTVAPKNGVLLFVIYLIISMVFALFWIYGLLCVISHYQELGLGG
ncbi:unnamed protein product [Gordionus sp. m RMFG-2023]